MFEFVGRVVLFFALFLAGNVSAIYTLAKEAPDLYEEWKRRREEKEGKQ